MRHFNDMAFYDTKRNQFKLGQLLTIGKHIYQVRKVPKGFLCCEYCILMNKRALRTTARCACCIVFGPERTYLKPIK